MNSTIVRVAMALLIDYTSVYYIDLKTNHYECYTTNQGFQQLELQSSGEDFFGDCQRDIQSVVYEEDREKLFQALSKESLLRELHGQDGISFVYRLMIDGSPVYHTLRVFHDENGNEDCLILGVLNVDASVRAEKSRETFNDIAQTLANRYATIYYVDLDTDHYIEYSSSSEYKDLEVAPEGDDFFEESRKNILRVIHPEDQEKILNVFTKDYLMSATEQGGKFQLEYRLMMGDEPHHVRLRAVRSENGEHLIIALDNIDEEIQKQEELKAISEKNLIFSQIAESLANQYGMIYYIDTETDEYIEFNATDDYKEFNISPTGPDFFGTSQRNVSMIIKEQDRERVFDALDKKTMLKKLEENGSFTLTYQLQMSAGDSYTRMSVFWANDKKHLIMGIMNIDSEVQRENTLKKMLAENAIFSQIAESLANQYDTIYYVDMLSDHYMEFSSTDVYKSLEVRPEGEDFFAESLRNIERVIYPEDRYDFHRILNKPTLIQMLQGKHSISHTYRLMIGDGVMYARMSIIWATDNKHIIVGVMNIDEEVRKEQETRDMIHAANEKAYRDELTGVKNKAAYTEMEAALQEQLKANSAGGFSILVCDVNGLKTINDRYGHIAGDAYIKSASDLICHIWSHSPVFRIGGDEFAVVIQGEDYDDRNELLVRMRRQIQENKENGKVIIATGLADYVPDTDMEISGIFERADNLMYENKAALKQA